MPSFLNFNYSLAPYFGASLSSGGSSGGGGGLAPDPYAQYKKDLEEYNIRQARRTLNIALDAYWGTKPDAISYSPSFSYGIPGTNATLGVRLGLMINLRGGDIGVFGSYGINYGITQPGPNVNLLSFGVHNTYGDNPPDVIAGMSGQSVGYEVNALGQGYEYSVATADGIVLPASSGVKSYNFNIGVPKPTAGGSVSWSNGWSGNFSNFGLWARKNIKYNPQFN